MAPMCTCTVSHIPPSPQTRREHSAALTPHPLLLLWKEGACSKEKAHLLFTPGALHTGF